MFTVILTRQQMALWTRMLEGVAAGTLTIPPLLASACEHVSTITGLDLDTVSSTDPAIGLIVPRDYVQDVDLSGVAARQTNWWRQGEHSSFTRGAVLISCSISAASGYGPGMQRGALGSNNW